MTLTTEKCHYCFGVLPRCDFCGEKGLEPVRHYSLHDIEAHGPGRLAIVGSRVMLRRPESSEENTGVPASLNMEWAEVIKVGRERLTVKPLWPGRRDTVYTLAGHAFYALTRYDTEASSLPVETE